MSTETGSDLADGTKSRISGKEATYVALAAAKYPPVKIGAPDNSEQSSDPTQTTPNLPAPIDGSGDFGSSGTETLSLEIVFIGSSSPSATLSGMVFSVAYYA
jgi:hypothetical protein